MTLQARDKRALMFLGAAAVIALAVWLTTPAEPQAAVVPALDSVPAAEKRLARLRQLAAAVPGQQQALEAVSAELAAREKGLIQADTAAQAQAQLLAILRRVGKAQAPAVEIRAAEMGQVRPLADNYGEVLVAVQFECRIEQLVNLLADLTAQPELISTSELRVVSPNVKEKILSVRLQAAGVVPRALVPEKKGLAPF